MTTIKGESEVSEEQIDVTVAKIEGKIDRITDSVEAIKETQLEMNEKMSDIRRAIYNPDEGLYARVRNQEAEIEDLKGFKASITRFLWVVTSAITGILIKIGFDLAG